MRFHRSLVTTSILLLSCLKHLILFSIQYLLKSILCLSKKTRILFIKIMQMQYQITVFNKLPHQFSFQSWELVPHYFYTFHAFCLSSFMNTSFSLILAHFIYHLLKSKYLHIHSFKLDGLNFFSFLVN